MIRKILISDVICVQAQSGSGYNYPSPFNQLTPGTNDLGNVPAANVPQQPSTFTGSQPGYSNQPFGVPGNNSERTIFSGIFIQKTFY